MAKFNLKKLKERKAVIKAKQARSKKQATKVLPPSKARKKGKGCGCGGKKRA